jgi:hypothetical protein
MDISHFMHVCHRCVTYPHSIPTYCHSHRRGACGYSTGLSVLDVFYINCAFASPITDFRTFCANGILWVFILMQVCETSLSSLSLSLSLRSFLSVSCCDMEFHVLFSVSYTTRSSLCIYAYPHTYPLSMYVFTES